MVIRKTDKVIKMRNHRKKRMMQATQLNNQIEIEIALQEKSASLRKDKTLKPKGITIKK